MGFALEFLLFLYSFSPYNIYGWIKLKDINIIDQAAKMVRDKFSIDFAITQCSREIKTTTAAVGVPIYLKPELKIALTVTKDHGGWGEHIDLEYSIYGEDLEDGSQVDELIGGDLKKQAPNMRQVLRLAFILYDGIRYGTTGEQKQEYADKGWLPKVTNIQRQSYVTK